MASKTLYPPIVDSYMPAFLAGTGSVCTVYFSLSKFNSSSDFKSVHATVVRQNTGMNVVKLTENRTTGIILNLSKQAVEGQENLYYIEITNNDLSSEVDGYQGWIPGWVYKIQLRLSDAIYDGTEGQEQWLNNNSNSFSEWSTICTVKATSKIKYEISGLPIDTREESSISEGIYTVGTSTLQLPGHFYRQDLTELIYSYNFKLYDSNDNIIEDSGDIYANKYQDCDSFNYTLKTELINDNDYSLAFKFITVNKYEDGFYLFDEDKDDRFKFTCSLVVKEEPPCSLLSIENDEQISTPTMINQWVMKDIVKTSREEEEDEGRIALKFFKDGNPIISCNLCVRRASSLDNFSTWTDIYLYTARQEYVNNIPVFYDYTAESGVWYKYGVQEITINGNREKLNVMSKAVMRNYSYSFLLGKDNQQLKLMFDNVINNFKYQIYDSKVDPIGSKFTNITRNAATYYRTFPINGLISFWMDENKLFTNKKDIYKYLNVIDLYDEYNFNNNIINEDGEHISQYDYIYERDFRNQVLKFLQDGEYKLFKSPTEGNIIVRLTDVNCIPNQPLDRMIYSFNANAHEVDAPTMENYLKYGFYKVDKYSDNFAVYETKLGQISLNCPVGTNIFDLIKSKYDGGSQNIAGYIRKVMNIHHIKITFDGKPLKVYNNAINSSDSTDKRTVLGNNFELNGKLFTVYYPNNIYEFDSRLNYKLDEQLIIKGDVDGFISYVPITVDFLYDFSSDKYIGKRIKSEVVKSCIGQFSKECVPNENVYKEIYLKYKTDWAFTFRKMLNLSSIEIEANPGAAFRIRSLSEDYGDVHIIGETGQLRLYELENINSIIYLGMATSKSPSELNAFEQKNTDVLINYIYLIDEGIYQEEV